MEGSSLSLGLALTSVMLSVKGCCGYSVASSSISVTQERRTNELMFHHHYLTGGQIPPPPPPHSPSQLTPDGNLDLKLQIICLAGWLVVCLPI